MHDRDAKETARLAMLIDAENATASGFIIDTMDLLHAGNFDGFCLVSSDDGFTRLALHEHGMAAEDTDPDFKLKVRRKTRQPDIAIFSPGMPHTSEHLHRAVAVAVDKEPKPGTKGADCMRDPEEAQRTLKSCTELWAGPYEPFDAP